MRIPTFSDPDALQAQLVFMVDTLVAEVTGGASPQEMASWPVKASAAAAILAGKADAIQAAMIGTEAAITGEKVADLAAVIAAKAAAYTSLIATIVGLRRKFGAAIAQAQPDDLDDIFAQIDAAFGAIRKAALS
jgi:hypothetical protein